jgi:hypothetical protein
MSFRRRAAEEEWVDVGEVTPVRETAKAWVMTFEDGYGAIAPGGERLVPKSQMNSNHQPVPGETFRLEVTEWFSKRLDEEEPERPHVEVPGAVVLSESRNGKSVQVRVEGKPQPYWIPVFAIHKDSEVKRDGDGPGVLKILETIAVEKGLAPGPTGGLSAGADARAKRPVSGSDDDGDQLKF